MSKAILGKEAAKFGPEIFGKIDAGQNLVQINGCKEEGTFGRCEKGARSANH